MDLFEFNDNGSTKIGSCCFREIKKLFRVLEILLILVFLTWVSTRVPFAVRISGEYFRQLLNVVVKPLFIFLLGNFIALTLFFKSRKLIFSNEPEKSVFEFIENGPYYFSGELNPPPPPHAEAESAEEVVVFQDKKTILEVKKVVKVHKRSRSENFTRAEKVKQSVVEHGGCRKELRRSETEKPVRVAAAEAEEEIVDDMSNEEFQRAIEDFIAKQIKFHKEEKMAIVLHATCST